MKVLLAHQNLPGQYLHLARTLAANPGNEVVFLTQKQGAGLPGVRTLIYRPHRAITDKQHHYLRGMEADVLNGQAVARVALELRETGFLPDLIVGHNGWGEIWYLKDVFPRAPLVGYFEFFYRLTGADVGFDPAHPTVFDDGPRLRTKNIGNLLGLNTADWGQCPTLWQWSSYPDIFRPKLIHEGIDTRVVVPNAAMHLQIPGTGVSVAAGDEVVTYVARNLEPYRGFPNFMRSLTIVLSQRPQARVLIVGGDEVSYGLRLPGGQTYRQQILDELGEDLDLSRVHFLGRVPYSVFLKILQVSRVHVYLTYPFVLSWSMLEAMAAGCLVVGSRTAPVEEVIRDEENGLLVDFFNHGEIADHVVAALESARAFANIRVNARQTIIDRYDLETNCLPAQLRFLDEARQSGPRI